MDILGELPQMCLGNRSLLLIPDPFLKLVRTVVMCTTAAQLIGQFLVSY